MISRLETLGYVHRETNPKDRRTDVVSITPEGLTTMAGVEGIWQAGARKIEGILGPEESKCFVASADKLSRTLGGGPPKTERSDQENSSGMRACECRFDCRPDAPPKPAPAILMT